MKILCKIFLIIALLGMVSCEKERTYLWNSEWDKYDNPEEKPDTPAEPEDPETPDQPQNPEEPSDPKDPAGAKARLVWIDAAANFNDYANDRGKIATDMAKIKDTGFSGVVVDVRPTNSGVLFNSSVEAPLKRVDAWLKKGYAWVKRTEDFDYLQAFIDEGKKVGLDVYASINTMVGGCLCPYGLGEDGVFYTDPSKKAWASVVNTEEGLVNCLDLEDTGAKFFNPANDEVVDYLLALLGDLAAYDLDGIILDRCRYDDYNLQSDFSDISKKKFEAHIGSSVKNWPDDIFAPGQSSLSSPATDMQKQWMEFRAKIIHDFIEKAAAKVHSVNPKIRFGAYVGAWYSSYYNSGVNWASPKYETSAHYSWATEDYNEYGYADHCDIMIIGAYAGVASIYGSSEWTMRGFCTLAEELFAGDVPYIGGPDIGNATGFENGGQGAYMPTIIDVCINACTEGMFIFDLCHVKMYNYWSDLKKGFDKYLETL